MTCYSQQTPCLASTIWDSATGYCERLHGDSPKACSLATARGPRRDTPGAHRQAQWRSHKGARRPTIARGYEGPPRPKHDDLLRRSPALEARRAPCARGA
eukprot:5101052-Pyramimonas_sp.AAC.1